MFGVYLYLKDSTCIIIFVYVLYTHVLTIFRMLFVVTSSNNISPWFKRFLRYNNYMRPEKPRERNHYTLCFTPIVWRHITDFMLEVLWEVIQIPLWHATQFWQKDALPFKKIRGSTPGGLVIHVSWIGMFLMITYCHLCSLYGRRRHARTKYFCLSFYQPIIRIISFKYSLLHDTHIAYFRK